MICPRCSIARIPDGTHECPLCGFKPATNVLVEQAAVDQAWQAVQQALSDRFWLEGLERLGERSFVYRARDLANERTVALKVIPVSQSVDQEVAQRFERYAAQAADLQHAHIVPIFEYGVSRRFLWYSMEFIEAPSLAEVLREPGPMALEATLRIAEQVASALDFAHRRGVVHGNLKPSNIMVDSQQWVRVTDFAVLEAFGRAGAPRAGAPVLHRPEYMAPEQFHARAVGASADQYALAVILYRCLSGTLPFVGDSFEEVARQQLSDAPPRLADLRRDLPVPVLDAIQRALSKVPAGRFSTALDFTAALSGTSRLPKGAAAPRDAIAPRSEGPPLLVVEGARRFGRRHLIAALAATIALAIAATAAMRPDLRRAASNRIGGLFGWEGGPQADPQWETLDPLPTSPQPAPVAEPSGAQEQGQSESTPEITAPPTSPPVPRQATPSRPGRLTVNSSPWGRVFIDGFFVGNTPQQERSLAPGNHLLRIEREGFVPFERQVRVRSGEALRLTDIVLRPIG